MATEGCFSDYTEEALLKHIFGKAPLDVPYLYVGLCTAEPGEEGTGVSCYEVPHANFYERASAFYWSEAFSGFAENTAAVVFNEVGPVSWGAVTHFALLDALVYGTGNLIVYGKLAVPRIVVAGSIPRFEIGEFVITLD